MATFKYKALDRNAVTVRGEIDATDETAAYAQLQRRKLDPFEISEKPEQTQFFTATKAIKYRDMARYVRQLATLLSAGVTLLEALASLARSNAHPTLASASKGIRKDLRAGERLSTAMETHIPSLPRYVPRLAELGEATGQSAKALSDAANRMEYEDSMREEIRTSLSYPIFLAVIGGILVFLMFLFIVPRFDTLIGDNRDNLPAMSRIVIGAGVGLKNNLILVLSAMGGLAVGAIALSRSKKFKDGLRSFAEGLPIIGPVLIQSDLGGWSRTVGIALDNGADILTALQLGELGLRSPRLRAGMRIVRSEIRAGRNVDEVLDENISDFDPLTIDLIRTGRTSGGLADMLLFVGETQESETRQLTKRLSALAEPIAILIIAAIVGTIVISIVLAMTSLYDFA
ncbi:type II secretion system F family protein [Fretibacter rubidus]|uniref:type II secretion system F family protein n=1 Tax=Fretibacter rubidus TaxID=570162 RepID=UPI003529E9DF